MGALASKLKSAFWFLRRPAFYPELLRRAWWGLTLGEEADTVAESESWCAALAVSTPDALRKLGVPQPAQPLVSRHRAVLEQAEASASRCPVKMGGAGDLELLYSLVRFIRPERVVETGVAYGWSSLAILLGLKDSGRGRLVSTDMPYVQKDNDSFVGSVVEESLRASWTLVRMPDRDALPVILREQAPIDLCHYDSDKSYRGRMWAYPKLWQALRPGGVMVSDDIGDNLGFKDFADAIGVAPVIVSSNFGGLPKFVGVLQKPS